jgi:16S rRNA C1402 (ribose-2'-O) methylase RsmI
VLVLSGAPECVGPETSEAEALALVAEYRAGGARLKDACRRAAGETGYAANALYQLALDQEEKE